MFMDFMIIRPQEGFRNYRVTFSVMHSRILWWLESGEDVFYPSLGVFHFPLVREENAPFYELFFYTTTRSFVA
jgi:hypothetical protein